MALEDKILSQSYRSIDTDAYDFIRKKEGSDSFAKFIFIALIALSLYIYIFITFSNLLAAFPNGIEAPVFLAVGLIVSTFIVIMMTAMANSKNKRLNNSSHLYAFKKEPGAYKIVENFSDSSVSISESLVTNSQEVDEDGNLIFYAEEVFDDEDNIFATEEAYTLLKKEKSITYKELVDSFNDSLSTYGVSGDLAMNLFASMAFSKLIDVTNVIKVIPTLFKVLDNPNYVIHYSDKESLTTQKVLANVFEYAKTHQNIPVFMLIDEIPSKEYLNYLRPLYRYIDDLNSDYYINLGGTMAHIPHNVYFLTALKEKDVIFDVSRRYLRYVSILKSDFKIDTGVVGDKKKFSITNEQLVNARRNAMESYSIEESTYKKLDTLFSVANEANGYVLQNKIQRKIEDFSAVLLSLNVDEEDVIDACLADNIIAAVVVSADPTKLMKDYNLVTILDNEFGQDKMRQTKLMIKSYLSLFNAKGDRQDA